MAGQARQGKTSQDSTRQEKTREDNTFQLPVGVCSSAECSQPPVFEYIISLPAYDPAME